MTLVSSEECVGFSSSHAPLQSDLGRLPPVSALPATLSPGGTQGDERNDRACSLAGRLHQFEGLLRMAVAAGARLSAEVAEESEAAGLSAIVGHQLMVSFGTANMHVVTALSHSAAGHRQLERLGQSLGYDTLAYGDVQKDPAIFNGA